MFYFIGTWQRGAVEAVFPLIHALPEVQFSIITFNIRAIDIFHKQNWARGPVLLIIPPLAFGLCLELKTED